MSKLIAVEYVSLDGVMQSPGRPDEDTRRGFDRGGWASERLEKDPDAAKASMGDPSNTRGLVLGRRTYLDLVGYWLSMEQPNPFSEILTSTEKFVASRRLTEPLEHPNSTLLKGDALEALAKLKKTGDGDLVILGSGVLVRELAAAGLIDEYVLTIIPVVLGKGTKLFGDTAAEFEVTSSMVSPTGIVVAGYAVR